jgi:hypothetical protein
MMSKLLFQDEVLDGMDVYVEYTFDQGSEDVVLYDYGLELDNPNGSRTHVSLRGYTNTAWIEERVIEFIIDEHTVEEDV